MSLKDTISNDIKTALISGNRFEVDVLRGLKAVILDEEVATGSREQGLKDSEVERLVAREIKKRGESAKLYRQNNRIDLAESEEKEALVLEKYLPEQISEDELRSLIDAEVAKLEVKNPQMMGKVIGEIKKQVGNSADGALIAQLVKEILVKK
ncbi:GatB/YqeY [Candidatus Saccharibacteria bacterium]|nr:MAG: GatB/YqeY [Candidatus Saccharibacteria bacterium]